VPSSSLARFAPSPLLPASPCPVRGAGGRKRSPPPHIPPRAGALAPPAPAQVRLATLRWAMLAHLRRPPPGFETVVREHFK
jgi:hypothetical protein